ncbi:MAG TPA: hypothetical protein VG818_00830 [Gemmatimonadaceae bacterium]|jgi:hypothetical protein|nr:hypothetical protein [Gemmatimonadaceae bacterium]
MKAIMIIHSGMDAHRVPRLLELHGASGYTSFDRAHGVGSTGRMEGTRAWPGNASVWLTFEADEQAARLVEALREAVTRNQAGEHMHVAVLPVETFF